MVESVNGVSSVQASAGVTKSSAAQKSEKPKNVPMIDVSKLTPEQKQAVENLKKQIAAGHVEYNDTNILEDILNFVIDKKSGDYIRISNFADPKEKLTFGEAKHVLKLNLPPGSLRCNKTERGGGNFDLYNVPKACGQYYLDIFIDDLEEATGLTRDEIKQLCEAK